MAVALKGTTTLREIWSSGEIDSSPGERRWIKKYQGIYTDLTTAEPAPGSQMVGNTAYEVTAVKITPWKGNLGEMTVYYARQNGLQTIDLLTNVQVDVNWIRDEIPFTQTCYVPGEPICNLIALIDKYLDEKDDAERALLLAQITALGAVALRLLRLISAGIRSYPVSRPVVIHQQDSILRASQLGQYLNCQNAPDVGTAAYPLAYLGPDGNSNQWVYVKMDDRCSRTGRGRKWRRTQEWHGLYLPSSMDPDLKADILAMYPVSP